MVRGERKETLTVIKKRMNIFYMGFSINITKTTSDQGTPSLIHFANKLDTLNST